MRIKVKYKVKMELILNSNNYFSNYNCYISDFELNIFKQKIRLDNC